MTSKTIILQNKKKTFLLRNFLFIVFLLSVLVNYRSNMTSLVLKEIVQKELVSQHVIF